MLGFLTTPIRVILCRETDIDTLEDQKEERRAEEALHQSSLTIPRR